MIRTLALITAPLFILFVGASANAQGTPPYGPAITYDQAKAVMAAAEAEAVKNNWAVVITILDSGGQRVMMHRMDNVSYGSIRVAEGKSRTAVDFRRPSSGFDGALAQGGVGLRILSIPGIMPIQGAVPIVFDGKVIGAIGTSGVTAQQDEQVSMAGAAALKGTSKNSVFAGV